ncbi:SCO7613 C-terminal domain-containing membrane protein [Planobispora longispora]|uniref:SCO7613 C-terminal domain-containing membrane protein n=1 Tax=Planobispora longispora TaxID=28887 RepID=UPI0019446B4F|nr:hypothetical protein [Planobispora longispora]
MRCPDCDLLLTERRDRCPRCALPLEGPAAAELWRLDRALAEVRARQAGLLARRGELLGILREERDRPGRTSAGARSGTGPDGESGAGPEGEPGTGTGSQERAGGGLREPETPGVSRGDISPKAVQNLLLSLGGLLLVVAAIVFTVVSWGNLGIGGRAAVLAGFTAVTLAVPKVLVARGLNATAETVAMLGVALLFLDGYAARRTGLAGADALAGNDYTAGVFAVVALILAGYSRMLPLRLPLPTAIVLAQFPLPLLAADRTATWFTAALTVTAVADALLLLLVAARNRSAEVREDAGTPDGEAADAEPTGTASELTGAARGVRGTVAVAFGIVWVLGVGCGFLDSALGLMTGFSPADWPGSSVKGALLAVLALTGMAVASRDAAGRFTALTVASTFALVAGLAAPWLPLVRPAWSAVVYTVAGLAVAAAAALRLPGLGGRTRSAMAVIGGVLAALTVVPFNYDITHTLAEPFAHLDGIWSGARGHAEEWPSAPTSLLVVLALLTAASAAAARIAQGHRELLGVAALSSGTLAVILVPEAFGWSHPADLSVLLTLAAVLVAGAAAARRRRWAGVLVCATGTVTVLAVATALAERTATHAALAVLALAWGGAAPVAGTRDLRSVAAGVAALLVGGEALAIGASLGLPPRQAAFAVLAVACLAATAAAGLWRPRAADAAADARQSQAADAAASTWRSRMTDVMTGAWRSRAADAAAGLEAAGYVLAACGLALAASGAPPVGSGLPSGGPDLPTISLACAVVGLMLTGTALRPDRRQAAYAGTGFLLLAAWTRLFASDITVIEAYTVPFSLVLLGFGWWTARAGTTSSWTAYGPALASSLLPSAIAMVTGSGWVRPLLLGTVSLAVLLIGTRLRLQAPAVLGGLTLAAVALHELAPWIAQIVVAVPRWAPMALGGLLLVVVGATYEARLREIRRLRETIGRMR